MRAVKQTLKRLLGLPANALIARSTGLGQRIEESVMRLPGLAAKFYPYQRRETSFVVPAAGSARARSAPLPAPPRSAWLCFEASAEEYLSSGREHVDTMREVLGADGFGFQEGARVLDFGCASGRMIRWLGEEAERCEIWGTDIQAEHIVWCQQHLSPPFHFVTSTTFPRLPFPDSYFNLIYAAGVFSQIADLADTWILELRRMLAPGGLLYITVHDRRSIELILRFPEDHRLHVLKRMLLDFDRDTGVLRDGFGMFALGRTPLGALVFYDAEHLRRTWGRIFRLRSVTPEAYLFQTALVLEKPDPGAALTARSADQLWSRPAA